MDERPIVDPCLGVLDLEDGYLLVWAVDGVGERWPWLMAPVSPDAKVTHGSLDDAPHEGVGPIPAVVRRRLLGDPRCDQPTADGGGCRIKVTHPGEVCSLHRRCRRCGLTDGQHSTACGWTMGEGPRVTLRASSVP
jgi:hypothetical protein